MKTLPCAKALLHSTCLAVLLLALIVTGCKKPEMIKSSENNTLSGTTGLVTINSVQPVKSEALLAMQCYNNAFYHQYGTYGPSFKAYYYSDVNHTGRMDFWRQAEAIETLIDAYNINNDTDLKNKMVYLYLSLIHI